MVKRYFSIALASCMALVISVAPGDLLAQSRTTQKKTETSQAGTASQPNTARKKQTAGPFHGKLKWLDRASGTLVMGTRTFQVTPQTKITKQGKPATLADGVIGESVSGYFKTSEDGKLTLSTLRFGPKPAEEKTTPERTGNSPVQP